MTRSRNRRSSPTSKGARAGIIPHQIINAQAACPRLLVRAALFVLLVRAALFALLGLLGVVSPSPWTGAVLIPVAGTGFA